VGGLTALFAPVVTKTPPGNSLARIVFRTIARAGVLDQLAECLALLEEWINAPLRIPLCNLNCGLHTHHRPWRLVHHISDPVIPAVCPSIWEHFIKTTCSMGLEGESASMISLR
jgi:hypothetical protein